MKIDSLKGVDSIHFGDSREKVRKEFGKFTEFRKNKFSKNTTDDFKSFHVYYNAENEVEAIEFFPESGLEFNDKKLFEMKFSDFNFEDTDIERDSCSITFKTLGFSVYSPSNSKIESIVVFRKGYYG